MAKERVDVLAYKQGLFDTREQAKRGVMAGLVVAVINGERFDKPGEKIDEATELKLKGEKLKYVSRLYRCHAAKWSQPGLFGGCRDQSVGLEIAQ